MLKPAPLWFKDLASIVLWWLMAGLVIIGLYPLVQTWVFIPITFTAIIVLLKQIYRIPFVGEGWKDLFGERKLWDWMQLLIVPVMLGYLSLNLKSSYEVNQTDIAKQKNREEVLTRYLDTIMELSRDFDLIKNAKDEISEIKDKERNNKELSEMESYFYANEINKKELGIVCNPHEDVGPILARSITMVALESLSEPKSTEQYNTVKSLIVDVLFQANLIDKTHAIVSLQKADLTKADMSRKYFPGTCFDSVFFNQSKLESAQLNGGKVIRSIFDSAKLGGINLDNADLRGSRFINADLQGANLTGANLINIYLKKPVSLFKGADLRGANLKGAIVDNIHIFDGAIINLDKIVPKEKHWIGNFVCNNLGVLFKTEHIDMCQSETQRTLEPTVLPESVLDRSVHDSMHPAFVKLSKNCTNVKDGSKITVRIMDELSIMSNDERDVCYLYLEQ